MPKISPIAQYLRANHAIAKHDKYGCHFISPEGLYLGKLTKAIVNNYRVYSLETYGEGLKKMYTKSIAIGQQYAYIKNQSAKFGVSLIPVKTFMRKIFVDMIEKTSDLVDTEKTLINKLNLIAIDEKTNVGLYDTEKPFKFYTKVTNKEFQHLKNTKNNLTVH